MDVTMPHEPFNTMVREGTVGKKMSEIMDAIKPEAAYFTERDGKRSAVVIVDLPDASKIPSLAEPWFLTFNADVNFRVAMTVDDLKNAGLESIGKKWAETGVAVAARR
ncbi:MAG: panthothenate synthetase [Terriglobales bacterium]